MLGAMRRYAAGATGGRTSSLGGRAEPCRLDPEAERLALAAAEAVGAEMAGVDLLADLDAATLVVLEVNAVPGLAGACAGDRRRRRRGRARGAEGCRR